jgi:hypothetical protein
MRKRRGNPNWGRSAPPVDVKPTRWETLLREVNVGADQAIAHIKDGTVAGQTIRRYAKAHAINRYIPEEILLLLGIDPECTNVTDRNR